MRYKLVQLEHVRKKYGSFTLELNMQIPENQIIADWGERGRQEYDIQADAWTYPSGPGSVEIFGKNAADLGTEEKQEIGAWPLTAAFPNI